jgi:hypothetical protein
MLFRDECILISKLSAIDCVTLLTHQSLGQGDLHDGFVLDKCESPSMNKSLAVDYVKSSVEQGLKEARERYAMITARNWP